jgi:hypothetical protein
MLSLSSIGFEARLAEAATAARDTSFQSCDDKCNDPDCSFNRSVGSLGDEMSELSVSYSLEDFQRECELTKEELQDILGSRDSQTTIDRSSWTSTNKANWTEDALRELALRKEGILAATFFECDCKLCASHDDKSCMEYARVNYWECSRARRAVWNMPYYARTLQLARAWRAETLAGNPVVFQINGTTVCMATYAEYFSYSIAMVSKCRVFSACNFPACDSSARNCSTLRRALTTRARPAPPFVFLFFCRARAGAGQQPRGQP